MIQRYCIYAISRWECIILCKFGSIWLFNKTVTVKTIVNKNSRDPARWNSAMTGIIILLVEIVTTRQSRVICITFMNEKQTAPKNIKKNMACTGGNVRKWYKVYSGAPGQALTLGLWMQWPGGPVDLKTYWPPKNLLAPQKSNWPLPQNQTCARKKIFA